VELTGRRAIVTGASSGIGAATVRALRAVGVRVAGGARRTDRIEADVALELDVTDGASCERFVDAALAELGGLDILVNNAGVFQPTPVDDTTPAAFEAALEVNLVAPFRLVHAFLPTMRARGRGDIVTIGSIADHTTFPGNAAYGASKHGLRALHEVLRAESRGSGVRVTLVSPGPVDTSLWDEINPDSHEGFTPRAKMLSPNAVAAAVLFAVSQPPEVDIELVRLSRS
jgi:NADP-dependent 3-hydroxy acid dehydrogenase YdfG